MRSFTLFSIAATFFILTCFIGAKALAATSEEETYAPIPELNYHPPKESDGTSMLDDNRLHAGAAFLNSYQNIPLGQGERTQGGMRGVQFNFGVDLFSPKWILQGALFSLPQATLGNATVSSNGFELSLLYETSIYEEITFHGGVGIESRNYGIRSPIGDNSMASGASVLVSGLDYWPAPFISTGLEVSAHLPLANGDDPSSIDLGIRLNGHF